MHTPIACAAAYSPPWYDKRREVFGSSDAAALCGFDDYRTPLHVFREKVGLVDPQAENIAMRLGHKLEPIVLSEYQEREGCEIARPLPMYLHPTIPYLAATPDAKRLDRPTDNLVEAKTTTWRRAKSMLGEEHTDWVPDEWMMQCQHQMLVMGHNALDLAALIDGRTIKIFHLVRNETLIQGILDAAKEMHERITNNDPPEPSWTHPASVELVKSMYGVDEAQRCELSAETVQHWAEYRRLKDAASDLTAQAELEKARVLDAMGHCAVGVFPLGSRKLVRRIQTRKEFTVAATSFAVLREVEVK